MIIPKSEGTIRAEQDLEREKYLREIATQLLAGMLASESTDYTYTHDGAIQRAVTMAAGLLSKLKEEKK